ncbi:hypothetical protein GCM10009618_01020 [Nesterenkonia lacusekhoensis]
MYCLRWFCRFRADLPRWETIIAMPAITVVTIMIAPMPAMEEPRNMVITVTEAAAPSMGISMITFMPVFPERAGGSATVCPGGIFGGVVLRAGRWMTCLVTAPPPRHGRSA